MAEGYNSAALLNYMPPEILENIFIYLPGKTLIRCREVNSLWRAVADSLCKDEYMWRKNCINDFPTMYEEARKKAKPGLLWFNLYRSMSLWKMFVESAVERDEFCIARANEHEIRNFKILDDGIIGVLEKNCIVYYDIETLEMARRPCIIGEYAKYTETKNLVVLLSFNLHLFVIRKMVRHARDETAATFENVTQYTLTADELYYVTLCDEIFVVYLRHHQFKSNYLVRSPRAIMTIGHSQGNLNVLTVQREILTVDKDKEYVFIIRAALGTGSTLLRQLQRYQFLENMDWRVYFQWMYMWNQTIPALPLRDVMYVKVYGDISFIGGSKGRLCIYHTPLADPNFDIFAIQPLRQYNFNEGGNRDLGSCPILNVDVMEGIDGHTVIVAIPKKMIVLNYTHDFEEISRMLRPPVTVEEIPEPQVVPEPYMEAGPSGGANAVNFGASTSGAGGGASCSNSGGAGCSASGGAKGYASGSANGYASDGASTSSAGFYPE